MSTIFQKYSDKEYLFHQGIGYIYGIGEKNVDCGSALSFLHKSFQLGHLPSGIFIASCIREEFGYSVPFSNPLIKAEEYCELAVQKGLKEPEPGYDDEDSANCNEYGEWIFISYGLLYEWGICVKKNLAKSFYYLHRAEKLNPHNSVTNYHLGSAYSHQDRVFIWYQKALRVDNAWALTELGSRYLHHYYLTDIKCQENQKKGLEYLILGANKCDPVAQEVLADTYEYGYYGISRNLKESVYWRSKFAQNYQNIAVHTLILLQYTIGIQYYFGNEDSEFPPDKRIALNWFYFCL